MKAYLAILLVLSMVNFVNCNMIIFEPTRLLTEVFDVVNVLNKVSTKHFEERKKEMTEEEAARGKPSVQSEFGSIETIWNNTVIFFEEPNWANFIASWIDFTGYFIMPL